MCSRHAVKLLSLIYLIRSVLNSSHHNVEDSECQSTNHLQCRSGNVPNPTGPKVHMGVSGHQEVQAKILVELLVPIRLAKRQSFHLNI